MPDVLTQDEKAIMASAFLHDAVARRPLAIIHRLAARLALAERVVYAYVRCDSNRGCYSCCEPHDGRCPKSRASSPAAWKGEWVCECGREELDAALAAFDGATNGKAGGA